MIGKMAEWSIASDLKSDVLNGTVSSNLTLSFISYRKLNIYIILLYNLK